MSESIMVALITGMISLVGIYINSRGTENRIMAEMRTHQAVTDTKIDELTREVREHNNFAKRVPVLEEKVGRLERRE